LFAEELLAAGLDGNGALPSSLRDALMVRVEITFLGDGDEGDPAATTNYELADSSLKLYDLYADGCDQHGEWEGRLSLRHAPLNTAAAGTLCAAVPKSTAAETLLMRVRASLTNRELWFRITP